MQQMSETSARRINGERTMGPTCIECRGKSKQHSEANRAKADEAKQLERIPWKEIIRMIEEGFDSQSFHTY
jgi:hypothetical protein